MKHHSLDVYPIPKEKTPMYINEPWLIDKSKYELCTRDKNPEKQEDNIRVYVPLDLNKKAILRRLDTLITSYGEANWKNESNFEQEVMMLIEQIEIYDQIWYVRHMPKKGNHSKEAIELVEEFVACLEEIPDGGAETFPFEIIDELKEEYLGIEEKIYIVDFSEFEKKEEAIRKENDKMLIIFAESLEGLSDKTIRRHVFNAEVYLNDYLSSWEGVDYRKGTDFIRGFLGDFFIHKCMWSTPTSIKSTAASIKKFYKCMLERGEIERNDYKKLCDTIKAELSIWQEDCARFNNVDEPYVYF